MNKSTALLTITLITSSLLSGATFASCNKFQCEGVTNVLLESIKADEKNFYLTFPQGVNETLECELIDNQHAKLKKNAANYSSMQSMLLTALTSNLPISITFDTTAVRCKVESVTLKVFE